MPIYEYENKRRGLYAEVQAAAGKAPKRVTLRRRTAPRRVSTGLHLEPAAADKALRAYYLAECRGQLKGKRKSQYTADQVRRAWEGAE